jgi:hypothetical protein
VARPAQVIDGVDQVMNQVKDSLNDMPFAKRRFRGKHTAVTRAIGNLVVALEDVKPYVKE